MLTILGLGPLNLLVSLHFLAGLVLDSDFLRMLLLLPLGALTSLKEATLLFLGLQSHFLGRHV